MNNQQQHHHHHYYSNQPPPSNGCLPIIIGLIIGLLTLVVATAEQ